MRMLGDRIDRVVQLLQAGQVDGEGGFGADLLGFGALRDGPLSMPRASRCSACPTVAPRMLATSASVNAASCPIVSMPSRFSFSSATGPIPQAPHRQPVEQQPLLGTPDHPNAVRFG